jgi:membrane-bound serine protease (ClpP class)
MANLFCNNLIITTIFLLSLFGGNLETSGQNLVQLNLNGEVDGRMTRYVKLGMQQAMESGADGILIQMDTYGGAVLDADSIRHLIMNYDKPTFTFINKNAGSAGALISIATDKIYMAKGATIGAATVVNGQDGTKAPDKYQSYMRGKMRATAEAKGRDPKIAEGMVDEDIEIDGITPKGEVITFSTSEAIKYGFAEAEVSSIDEILKLNDLSEAEITQYELSSIEKIIRFFMNPVLSSVLILIMLGGIYFELQSPGVGFPILASLVAGSLYFTPYYLNGVAVYWEIILFGVGLLLIAAEVFIIPGFGIAGIAGIVITVGSLMLAMLENDGFSFDFVPVVEILNAFLVSFSGLIGFFIILLTFGHKIADSPLFSKMVLQNESKPILFTGESFTATSIPLIGKSGVAYTVLRPSGKVELGGEIYNAVSTGDYISAGEPVVVVDQSGHNLRVKREEVLA